MFSSGPSLATLTAKLPIALGGEDLSVSWVRRRGRVDWGLLGCGDGRVGWHWVALCGGRSRKRVGTEGVCRCPVSFDSCRNFG